MSGKGHPNQVSGQAQRVGFGDVTVSVAGQQPGGAAGSKPSNAGSALEPVAQEHVGQLMADDQVASAADRGGGMHNEVPVVFDDPEPR